MTPPQAASLDPPAVLAALLVAAGLSEGLANIIGPYAVILLGATCGAAWALGDRPASTSKGWAVLYFLRINVTALLLVAGLATLAHKWTGFEGVDWLLAPIAIVVGGVGDNWPAVGKWVLSRLGRLIENKTGTADQGKQGDSNG